MSQPIQGRYRLEDGKGIKKASPLPAGLATSAIPPGNEDLFSLGMKLAMDFKPLSKQEADEIKMREFNGELLFRYEG